MPKHADQDHTKKQYFGRLPSADESDSEESSGMIVVGKLESHSISAKVYIDSSSPSNIPQLITLATDTGVSKTMLNRLDWEKGKHLCTFVKTSKRFRPFGTAYHLPIREKAKVTLCAEKGATIESYVYVVDDKQKQSLLGEHLFGYSQTPPSRSTEAVSPDKPESEAQVSRRISYHKRSESPQKTGDIIEGRLEIEEPGTYISNLVITDKK